MSGLGNQPLKFHSLKETMPSDVRWCISVYQTKTYQNTYQFTHTLYIFCLLTLIDRITMVPPHCGGALRGHRQSNYNNMLTNIWHNTSALFWSNERIHEAVYS